MQCDQCGFKNPPGMHFCGKCAAALKHVCPTCQFANPTDFRFCGQCSKALDSIPLENPTPPRGKNTAQPTKDHHRQEAERRQLTVLFCDMVGSSALSERIDPEDLRDIMRGYRSACNDVVSHFDGHVAQYLGDGILVYFGYPQAHEDDARRATQAALDIVRRVSGLRYPLLSGEEVPLSVRVGVHTGLVVVGEIGDGDKRTLALGETPNIAARLQELSTPNSVIVSNATHHLIGDDFDFEDLGGHQLKGFSQPLNLYRVTGEHSTRQRLLANRGLYHEPLVGRDQETALLMERLEQACKGVGQVVLLGGEAGLGKTRMVQMVLDRLANKPCFIMECGSSPYYKNSFLYPIIDLMQRTLGLADITDNTERQAHLQQSVETLGLDTVEVIPALAELLGIHTAGIAPDALGATPQQRKQKILNALVSMLQSLAQQKLIVLVVEDLHWVDSSTLELLTLLVEQPGLTNLFALFTFRSEFAPPWNSHANLTLVTLNRLTRQQAGHLIRQLSNGKTLPVDVFAEIIRKTDGVPYFIEELTGMVLNSDMLEEKTNHYVLKAGTTEMAIPSTLQDSLMSRLDGLGEDKELAQLSATLGREFGHDLLSALAGRDETSLRQGLAHLINADLFLQRGHPPNASYSFRHALLREAAYQSLLKRTRQHYHQRIANLLQERFPHVVEANPELLAHHCNEACIDDLAAEMWLKAGKLAVRRSANQEAAIHLQHGLVVLKRLPDSPERLARELEMQTTLGLALMMSRGYAAPAVEKAYARARELCRNTPDIGTTFPVLCGLWEYYIVRADLSTAESLANELLDLAAQDKQPDLKLEARRTLGTTRFWQGRLDEALELLTRPHSSPAEIPSITAKVSHSQDVYVAGLANLGCILWLLGQPDQALEKCRQALEAAKRLTHPFSQAYALQFLAVVHQLRGEHEATQQQAEAQIALCETYGFAFWSATGKMLRAWAKADDSNIKTCCEEFQSALAKYEQSGSRLVRSYFLALLAELQFRAGQSDAANATLAKALEETEYTQENFFSAELLRLKGHFLQQTEPTHSAQAEALFTQALQQAEQQNAHSLALRCSIDIAIQAKHTAEVQSLLSQQLKRIDGGIDTQDVKRAHEALH
ncbi:Proteins incorrectly called adenylate cyclase [hydrothermal vent metagenome]|uniref:Proteins incorrectly called adenylate cyclase n=1 Tax=hydrothermal vent metagenome TaxID=652676 RepID=A0A3B1B064_9ZZZZ